MSSRPPPHMGLVAHFFPFLPLLSTKTGVSQDVLFRNWWRDARVHRKTAGDRAVCCHPGVLCAWRSSQGDSSSYMETIDTKGKTRQTRQTHTEPGEAIFFFKSSTCSQTDRVACPLQYHSLTGPAPQPSKWGAHHPSASSLKKITKTR